MKPKIQMVMVILKEPKLGYSRTNIKLTARCNDCKVTSETQQDDVHDPVSHRIFAARAVVNKIGRPRSGSPIC